MVCPKWILAVAMLAGCAAPAGPGWVSGTGAEGKADGHGGSDRRVLVWSEISRWNEGLEAADRASKLEKMRAGPFIFFRGTNHLFWRDLAADERLLEFGDPQSATWIQGDLHAENFGTFADDQGDVVYDLNDFDESVVADYQYDLWRMATSIVLVGRDQGLYEEDVFDAVDAFSVMYLDATRSFVDSERELGLRVRREEAYGRLDELLADVEESKSRENMLSEWTVVVDGSRTLDPANGRLEAVDRDTEAAVRAAFAHYPETLSSGLGDDEEYFVVKGVARRLDAGTGSLGTPRYYVLVEGASASQDDDVILDVKRQGVPTAFAYLPEALVADQQDRVESRAERVVLAQRAMLTNADDHLGWLALPDGRYSVRERSPFKESLPLDELDTPTRLRKLAEQWGSILAAAHCRADRDFDPSFVPVQLERVVTALVGRDQDQFVAIVREVASEYADQVLEDYGYFLDALEAGAEPPAGL